MLVARAFVLGLNARALLALSLVGMSVAYAIIMGAAAGGLQMAQATLSPDLLAPGTVVARSGLQAFDEGLLPADATSVVHRPWGDGIIATSQPWGYAAVVVPGAYASPQFAKEVASRFGLEVDGNLSHPVAPGTWVLVPPEVFWATFPELRGLATVGWSPSGAQPVEAQGLLIMPSPAAGGFYELGAAQVYQGVHLVIAAMGLSAGVLAAGVLRLEVLARSQDLATLEALGGSRVARRAIVLRTLFIVGLGVAAGVAVGLFATFAARRAMGALDLRASLDIVALAALVVMATGTLAGIASGLSAARVPVAGRLGRRGTVVRRFPGPVRFLIVTPRVFPAMVAASLVLTSIASVVVSAAGIPALLFQPSEEVHVVGQASGNPFRGSASRLLGEWGTWFPGINASSPETFAPSTLDGRPVMIRGVDFPGWRSLQGGRLVEGVWPADRGQATLGVRLANQVDWSLGDEVLVPGAYRPTVASVRIVGIHESGSLEDDEILVNLDTAGDLAALPPTEVHMIRFAGPLEKVRAARIADPMLVTSVRVEPAQPVPWTRAQALIDVFNTALVETERSLVVRVNGIVVGGVAASAPPGEAATFRVPFTVPGALTLNLSVNPELVTNTSRQGLRVDVPGTVTLGEPFKIRVRDDLGRLVDAELDVDGRSVLAPGGEVDLVMERVGRSVVSARSGSLLGGAPLFVVEPEWALSGRLVADHAVLLRSEPVDAGALQHEMLVTVTNVGGASFDGALLATLEGQTVGQAQITLEARQSASVRIAPITPLNASSVEVAGLRVPLEAPPRAGAPAQGTLRTVEDVIEERERRLQERAVARELSGASFLDDVFRKLEPTVVVVVMATFLHAAAGVAVSILREVKERGEIARVLDQLGATPDQVRARAARDAILSSLPPLLLGAGLAIAGFSVLGPLGFPSAFGHTISASPDPAFVARAVGGLSLVAVATAALAAGPWTETPLQQTDPKTLQELVGDKT